MSQMVTFFFTQATVGLRPEPVGIFAVKTNHVTVEPVLSWERVSGILTAMSLITPDDRVTGGMQTSYLLSVNSLRLPRAAALAAPSTSGTGFSGRWQRHVLLCADPLRSRYDLFHITCAFLELGPNTVPIIRATFLLQGGMRSETRDPGNDHAAKLRYPLLLKRHTFVSQSSVTTAVVWLLIQLSATVLVKWKQVTAALIWITTNQWRIHTRDWRWDSQEPGSGLRWWRWNSD